VLQVSVRKRATNSRPLLWKTTYKESIFDAPILQEDRISPILLASLSIHGSAPLFVCFGGIHIQGGDDASDALSCRSLAAKESLIIGLFCGKRPIKKCIFDTSILHLDTVCMSL